MGRSLFGIGIRSTHGPCLGALVALSVSLLLGASSAPASALKDPFTAVERSYWAFQAVTRPAVPATRNPQRTLHPIDAFVVARLEARGLALAPPAGKVELLRRVYFDLIGLPPDPAEVEAFLNDSAPDAYERVVERLLASPHYGERWGRHWLDLARFAESDGFEQDVTRPNAWRYRDYVIRAFNADRPYDRFVQEQLAGDELWPGSSEARIATAFNRHYAEEGNQKDLLLARQETLDDITKVVGSTFLGLTFECARCHDHKFDPIRQKDYYRLQAFFANVNHDDRFPIASPAERRDYERKLAAWESATEAIWAEMADLLMPHRNFTPEQLLSRYPDFVIEAVKTPASERSAMQAWMSSLLATKDCGTCPLRPQPYRDPSFRNVVRKLSADDRKRFDELDEALAKLEHLKPPEIPRGTGIVDVSADAPPTHVLGGGVYTNPLEEVQPGFLSILDPEPARIEPVAGSRTTGRRAALSRWLTDPANPLAARVMANRIWQHHFGMGIVASSSDFGVMGERPTHPELLDWLAAEFVDSGWSVKRMHRLIVTSATYRQSARVADYERLPEVNSADSRSSVQGPDADPGNRLLGHFPVKRLEGEIVRDAALSAAGLLNGTVGGPSVYPALPAGVTAPAGGWKADVPPATYRRSVYVFVKRNAPYPMLDAFDFPDTHEPCARRYQSTTAPQALALLNAEESQAWARAFAQSVEHLAGPDAGSQVEAAYRLAYSRKPDPWERDAALTFLNRQRAIVDAASGDPQPAEPAPSGASPNQVALSDFTLMLLNSNEFAYRF